MTTPHEWFGPEEYGPHLHNRHAAEPYFDDPDYWGHHHGPALPAISTIGRGPRGRGLYIANLNDSDGQLSFDIMEEGTNELVYSVPNIAGDIITNIRIEHDNVQPGDVTPLDITVKRGGEERTYTIDLPSGAPGSTMFLAGEFIRTSDDTYHTTVGDITLYGKPIYRHRPWPRPNDTIACTIREQDGSYYLAIGTIENVGGNQNNRAERNPLDTVVFTCRTFAKIPDVSISADGTWIVGGADTGVLAKGEKGDKGDRGEQGPRGLTGATGPKGDKGDTGDRGPKGDPGVNGRNGRDGEDGKGFELGEVTTSSAAYGQPASATFTIVAGTENTYDLDLVIPEGKPGEELNWQPGIWPYDQLPSWSDTPVNTIFVVRDTDCYLDLYIRGQLPVEAELGGPWVVVENILQYPIDYKELEGSPIVWNETTQEWEYGNGFELADIARSGEYEDIMGKPFDYRQASGRLGSSVSASTWDSGSQSPGSSFKYWSARGTDFSNYDTQTSFKIMLRDFVNCCIDLGCPVTIDNSQASETTISTNVKIKIGNVWYEDGILKCRSKQGIDSGGNTVYNIQYEISRSDGTYISLTASGGSNFFDFNGSTSGTNPKRWTLWQWSAYLPASSGSYQIDTRTPAAWISNDYFDIWDNILNKPDFATQAEVNAAIDAVIASRS